MPSFCRRISTIGWAFCITCWASSAGTKPTRSVRVWLSELSHPAAKQSARPNIANSFTIGPIDTERPRPVQTLGSGLFRPLLNRAGQIVTSTQGSQKISASWHATRKDNDGESLCEEEKEPGQIGE